MLEGEILSSSIPALNIEGIFNDIQRIRIRVTRHRTSGHSFLPWCTSRATIGAYFCISLADSSLAAASKGDSQLSRATGRRAFQRSLRGTRVARKEKYHESVLSDSFF